MSHFLGRSSFTFALMTLVSRLLGLLRDMLIARYFTTGMTDPFFAALRIPNTLRRFFAEGGFANAFVPVLAESHAHADIAAERALLRDVTGSLLAILIFITLLGMLASSWLLSLVAFGLRAKPEQFILADTMLKIMFPYIILISLTALSGGILNVYQRFAVPALTPALLNVALIVAALIGRDFFSEEQTVFALAWAVLLGGALQLGVQLPFLWRLGLLQCPRVNFHHPGVRRIMRLMLPTLFGSSVGQLSILLNTALASMMITGSISWLYYSDRMVELPVALIGVALGTVILPRLSALKDSQPEAFLYTLDWALRWALLLGCGAATGLLVCAPHILATLFYGGVFSEFDILMSSRSLRAYALGAFALVLVKVLAPAFYARQDTATPVKAGIIALSFNMLCALTLSHFWQHVGLAAASSLASLLNVLLLLWFLYRQGIFILHRGTLVFLCKVLLANAVMALFLLLLLQAPQDWLLLGRWSMLWRLLLLIVAALVVYAAALLLLGLRRRDLNGTEA